MARFNSPSKGATKTENFAGGQAYTESPELELISLLLTSFANDKFYEKAEDTFDRLKVLIAKCDKKFVAQAAIYARTKFGMRSISHVVASELAKYIGGIHWGKDFYNAIVYRPDDMVEILAYHFAKNGKETKAMRNGFGRAFNKFDAYQLAKYRCENRSLTLWNVAQLMHPKPTEGNKEALSLLKKGELKSTETWESKLTQAGQKATNAEEKDEFKKDAWTTLIKQKKIGYFAVLKNLRNIIEQAPEALPDALETLTNEKLIKSSLVLPFRFTTAYSEIEKMHSHSTQARITMVALNKAIDISTSNVPKFEGTTLVVLDVSSSMRGGMRTGGDKKTPAEIGGLFAAVLVKANNCDFMVFEADASYHNINPNDSTITISKQMRFNGGSTNFHSIFQRMNKKYDRIIILSDMQGWVGSHTPVTSFNEYKKRTGANPFIYSFDLNGYGTLQFPEQNVFCVAGFSDKVFDLMKLLETDKRAMINEIKKIEF